MCRPSPTSSRNTSWFWRLSAVRTVADSLRRLLASASARMAECVDARTTKHTRLVWRLMDIHDGLYWGYPPCCVLRFATAWKYHGQAWRRGMQPIGLEDNFVVCGVFHRPSPLEGINR